MRNLKVLLDKIAFPEGPRWHDGKLYFSDMHAHKVMTVDMNGKTETICEVPNRPSGLGWLPDGTLLIVSMTDRKLMRLERGALKLHADLGKLAAFDCNDMVVDTKGRAYVGNFGYDLHNNAAQKDADLIMVTPEGKASVVASGLQFPNGTVITRDGKTLIVGESMGRRLSAFDIATDGTLSNRRLLGRHRARASRWHLPRCGRRDLVGVAIHQRNDSRVRGRTCRGAHQDRSDVDRVRARRRRRQDAVHPHRADGGSGAVRGESILAHRDHAGRRGLRWITLK